MMLAVDRAMEDKNPFIGHNVMAKNREQVGKFEAFYPFGHNFMANAWIVLINSLIDN